MLRNTFVHIPGIGAQTEARLWSEGCLTWEDLLSGWKTFSFGRADRSSVVRHVEKSVQALENGEHQFFARSLKMNEAWRAYHEFRDSCLYLDIETDGGTEITTIGVYDGIEYVCLVQGEDLGSFVDLVSNYSMLVTFAGHMFDLPMLQRRFKMRFDHLHIDLCPTFKQAGIRGGLKKIEKDFGIARDSDVDGLNGLDAVRLWRRYKLHQDSSALERLIAYNRADVVNLEKLAEEAYSRLRAQLFDSRIPPDTTSGEAKPSVQGTLQMTHLEG